MFASVVERVSGSASGKDVTTNNGTCTETTGYKDKRRTNDFIWHGNQRPSISVDAQVPVTGDPLHEREEAGG